MAKNSKRLGELEFKGDNEDERARIMRESFEALAEPI